MTVVTRFAPSPTGFLHIGSARTALFNWLYARKHNGRFLLRIEDTDRERSTQGATDAIIDGMKWLGLEWDGEVVHQFARAARHAEVARELLEKGGAYYCYTSQAELASLREAGKSYDRKWRDSTETPPAGVKPVIRLKSPLDGEVVVRDHVRGDVRVPAGQLEDLVILRSDGTPTYNLAVVVDDHDMGVTHVIRGEDHLTNAAKQVVMYQRMGWDVPEFAHVPMIHGPDGAKLSKRHGALGVEAYRDMGYLPEALRNYLLRLGWSHGDDEIISTEQAIEWFNLEGTGKSASRFDFVKLENLNGHYIREAADERLVELIVPLLNRILRESGFSEVDDVVRGRLLKGMKGLKQRANTLKILANSSVIYTHFEPSVISENVRKIVEDGKAMIDAIRYSYEQLGDWSEKTIEEIARQLVEKQGIKLGLIAQPLRAALTFSTISPPVFEVMAVLGKEETLKRLNAMIK
jgi:glutamyl-tRNA synthetase